jgi:predicted transposase/invertase (TIGR01784 family)
MFGEIMKDERICKGVIERLLKIKIDHIEYPELQKEISPLYTQKGVRLDVYVAGSDKVFDIEAQSYKLDDIGERMRYYQAMIDIDNLMRGMSYSELKESYILFLCTNDPLGYGLPVYTFERVCKEDSSVALNDKTHHIIFNAEAANEESDSELKDFMTFLKSNEANSEFTKEIASMVQTKKFEQSFINEYMAWNLHDDDVKKRGVAEGIKIGMAQGIQQANCGTARNLLAMNMPIESIAKATGLSIAEIQALN